MKQKDIYKAFKDAAWHAPTIGNVIGFGLEQAGVKDARRGGKHFGKIIKMAVHGK